MTDRVDLPRSLRLLAQLLAYPDPRLRRELPALRAALGSAGAIQGKRRVELTRLVDRLLEDDGLESESAYVALFDRGRSTSLHLFEHVHGDSRDRGPAMIDLMKTYEAAGLYLRSNEMPDHLPVFLEYASTQPPPEARASLVEIAHILKRLFSALAARNSLYASVIGALIELSGERASPVELPPEEPLDATWEEPPAFGGCDSRGQSRPDSPQPIRFIDRP